MFKIGMFTSGYQRNPLEDIFCDAKRFGYDYIELWGGRPHAYAPDLAAGEIVCAISMVSPSRVIAQSTTAIPTTS